MATTPRRYALPISPADGEVRLVPRLRERYLTPQTDTALVHAIGDTLSIWLWTARGCVRVDLPLRRFVAERPFKRSLHRWGVNVNRWMDWIDADPTDDGFTVDATVTPVDIEAPDDV